MSAAWRCFINHWADVCCSGQHTKSIQSLWAEVGARQPAKEDVIVRIKTSRSRDETPTTDLTDANRNIFSKEFSPWTFRWLVSGSFHLPSPNWLSWQLYRSSFDEKCRSDYKHLQLKVGCLVSYCSTKNNISLRPGAAAICLLKTYFQGCF